MISFKIRRAVLSASALLLAACGKTAVVYPSTAPTPFADIRREWEAAFNRADTAALVALYAPDAVLVQPVGTVLTGGHVAARETLGRLMEDRTQRLLLTHQRSAGSVGHVQGGWQARRRDTTGGPLLATGTYVMLFERAPEGRWQIVYHAWTQDRNTAPDRRDAEAQ